MKGSFDGNAGLFFVVDGEWLLHMRALEEAEPYGDFHGYPENHDDVWQREYAHKYQVDFDYFPRGRIVSTCVSGSLRIGDRLRYLCERRPNSPFGLKQWTSPAEKSQPAAYENEPTYTACIF